MALDLVICTCAALGQQGPRVKLAGGIQSSTHLNVSLQDGSLLPYMDCVRVLFSD